MISQQANQVMELGIPTAQEINHVLAAYGVRGTLGFLLANIRGYLLS